MYKTFAATSAESNFEDGKYSKKATLTGLSENTRYAYVFAVGNELSKIYYFDVGSFGDFELVYIADALSVYRVAKIIGYSERTIRWHIAKGRLFAMQPKSEWNEKAIIKRNESTSLFVSE